MRARWPFYAVGILLLALTFVVAVRSEHPPPASRPVTTIAGVDAWACPEGTVGRVSCAYVDVPEDYSDPEIRQVRLFTARISPPIDTGATPIVFIGNELGSAAVQDFGDWQRVARSLGRTVYLLDLRGSGSSLPRLRCPDVQSSTWAEADLSDESVDDARDEVRGLIADCADRLSSTVALAAFDLDAMAADLDVAAERLGVEQWIVFAGGDAGFVARRAAANGEDHVESLVLFGAAPSLSEVVDDRVGYAAQVLEAGLSQASLDVLPSVIAPLENRSIVFPVQAAGRSRRIAVNDAVVLPVLARQLADPDFSAAADNYVQTRLADEQWRSLAVLRDRQQRAIATRSLPIRLAVVCGDPDRDPSPWWGADTDGDGAMHDWLGLMDDPVLDPDMCDYWVDVSAAPDVEIGVPTLVVNGEFDVTAPAAAAEQLDEDADVTALVVPGGGRPRPIDDCVRGAIEQFVARETPTLDACG